MLVRRVSLLSSIFAVSMATVVAALTIFVVLLIALYPSTPPESTLSYEGQTATGMLGLYCWGRDSLLGPRGPCVGSSDTGAESFADNVPPFTGEALKVPEGASLVFEYGGEEPPVEVSAESFVLEDGELRVPELRETFETDLEGGRAEFSVDLPKGEYGVSVYVSTSEGHAYYGFSTTVE